MANVLRHERFERAPVAAPKRRRSRLPAGVVSIRDAVRLPVGSVAVIVVGTKIKRDTESGQNLGKCVRITHHDPRSAFSVLVDSLDGPLALDGGGKALKDIRYRPANLRRVWTGLSENERIQLRLWRQVTPLMRGMKVPGGAPC
jgi:hypothetical protein